ncbi:MAG: non-heme iron oxygenase ferredoxin subunit [Actinomycetes bacterium]|jgi:3-phenylpropionate/trans-cinnamate dioxygenase ferredoxin subunit
MTNWNVVGKVSDFAMGSAKAIDLNGETICLVRNKNGFHAISDACSHGAVSLSEGSVTDEGIECFLHGSEFNLQTGEPKTPPATSAVDVFAVQVDGDGDNAVVSVRI